MASSPRLLESVPPGFRYTPEFLSQSQEQRLVEAIVHVEFSDFEMRGVVARRRVAFFGQSYDRAEARPLPDFLLPLRARIGDWTGIDETAFEMCLINEYTPGAPIGWHRDAPQYDIVAGVSLLSSCRMKFRPYRSPASLGPAQTRRSATHEIVLERRSVYVMTQESRHLRASHSSRDRPAVFGDVSNAPHVTCGSLGE